VVIVMAVQVTVRVARGRCAVINFREKRLSRGCNRWVLRAPQVYILQSSRMPHAAGATYMYTPVTLV